MLGHGQRFGKPSICTNCGLQGHHFRNCTAPVTSYGIIGFRVKDPKWNQSLELSKSDTQLTGIPADGLEILLIQRRDSIGYVEILRAKYKLSDLEYIKKQIEGITQTERDKLLKHTFQELWIGLWGSNSYETKQYKQEYEQAKLKFDALQEGYDLDGHRISFQSLFAQIPVTWETPEWGFPKGRRNTGESDYACAIREFNEETNLTEKQYKILDNLEPLREEFYGNNGIHYCHIYYLAQISSSVPIQMNKDNELMTREVGGISWFSLDAAIAQIRSTNTEKRAILSRVSSVLQHLCGLLVGPFGGESTECEGTVYTGRKEGENTNRKQGNESCWKQQRNVRAVTGGGGTSGSSESTVVTTAAGCITERTTFSFVEDSE